MRRLPLLSPLPGSKALAIVLLPPSPLKSCFLGVKRGVPPGFQPPPPLFLNPSNHFKLAAAVGFLGPVNTEGTCGLQRQESHAEP